MSTIINGTSSAITFPDSSVQNTSAIVSGYVPYANLPAGSVLQVVNVAYSTQASTSSSTYADTGLTASITPKFATSKILVFVDMPVFKEGSNTSGGFKLLRNSTDLIVLDTYAGYTNSTAANGVSSLSTNYLDSPATTSSTSYKVQFKSMNNSSAVYINLSGYGAITSTITLMEIAA